MPNISPHKDQEHGPHIAAMFAALGDHRRLKIVSMLQDGSGQSISKLAQGFSLTRQGVSRHLHVLENAGLVRSHIVGRETLYHLEIEELKKVRQYLVRASEQWDDAIARLSNHLDG